MTEKRRLFVQAVLELSPEVAANVEAITASVRAAIQVGLGAQVLQINAHLLAPEVHATHLDVGAPYSEPDERDRLIEQYDHSGMQVQIYRASGTDLPVSYFALLKKPSDKGPSGVVMEAETYLQLKQVAELRAERRSLQAAKRQSSQPR